MKYHWKSVDSFWSYVKASILADFTRLDKKEPTTLKWVWYPMYRVMLPFKDCDWREKGFTLEELLEKVKTFHCSLSITTEVTTYTVWLHIYLPIGMSLPTFRKLLSQPLESPNAIPPGTQQPTPTTSTPDPGVAR